jgi:rod shape-determining protein MreD
MQMNNYVGFFRVMLTLVLAMSLRIAPWPGEMAALNPDWVLLVLIYWSLAIPERVGIFHAWTFGLLTDVLTGRLLGQYALAYSLVIYICLKLHKRLRQFPLLQQGLFIFFCLLLSQLLLFFNKKPSTPGTTSRFFLATCLFRHPVLASGPYGVLRFVRLSRRIK